MLDLNRTSPKNPFWKIEPRGCNCADTVSSCILRRFFWHLIMPCHHYTLGQKSFFKSYFLRFLSMREWFLIFLLKNRYRMTYYNYYVFLTFTLKKTRQITKWIKIFKKHTTWWKEEIMNNHLPNYVFVFFVLAFGVFPSPKHNWSVDIGRAISVGLIEQAHHRK